MAVVGKDLALMTAGVPGFNNSMTILFGGIGKLWFKDVYFAFVKPERYTYEFVNNNEYFTVSYFPEEFNHIHEVFGYKSGRDIDKVKETGLTPQVLQHGMTFQEANEVFVCKKMYMKQMDPDFIPKEVMDLYHDPKNLIHGQTHYLVVGEIVDLIQR